MIHRLSDKTLAALVFVGVLAFLTLCLIGPAGASEQSAQGRTFTVTALCTHPDKRDADCGTVRKYANGGVQRLAYQTMRWAARAAALADDDLDQTCRVIYYGYTSKPLPTHGKYIVTASRDRGGRWDVYSVTCKKR